MTREQAESVKRIFDARCWESEIKGSNGQYIVISDHYCTFKLFKRDSLGLDYIYY